MDMMYSQSHGVRESDIVGGDEMKTRRGRDDHGTGHAFLCHIDADECWAPGKPGTSE